MKAKPVLRHQPDDARLLLSHTTGILPETDQRLHELLQEWRPGYDVPHGFAKQVWQRIQNGQPRRTHA